MDYPLTLERFHCGTLENVHYRVNSAHNCLMLKILFIFLAEEFVPRYLQNSCISKFEAVEQNSFPQMSELVNYKALCLLEK